ncbi:hypothetical protein [Pseudoclavibacter helvolus]|uniref:Tail terminator n=1 Tax=Pseudoclavibacter helvolus TaxID=255205 RepID=A0A7W4UMA4_9MICO|nr:hypothetical protein [Pseudoclavibacter helvolus]MBB2956788.1 hypothetical protein [Pseudoclavibacter helvolus]
MKRELDAFKAAIATDALADRVDIGRTKKPAPHVLISPAIPEDEQTRMTGPYSAEQLLFAVRCTGTDLAQAMWHAEEVDERLRPAPMKFGIELDVEGRVCSQIERGPTETFPDDDTRPTVWVVLTLYRFTSEPS